MYFFLMIAIMVASYIVQNNLQSRFNKYSRVPLAAGLTGAEVAQRMLHAHGIYDVKVVSIPGQLTDNYNPVNKTLNLSASVYGQRSLAAAAVAAHECGHAVQHAVGYGPLKLRSSLVPVVSFASSAVSWILLAGLLMINTFPTLFWLGIALFAMTTIFSIVTLPVEINASARAVKWLESAGLVYSDHKSMAVDALKWAAYTYVVAAVSSLGTLLYYISIANSRRN